MFKPGDKVCYVEKNDLRPTLESDMNSYGRNLVNNNLQFTVKEKLDFHIILEEITMPTQRLAFPIDWFELSFTKKLNKLLD